MYTYAYPYDPLVRGFISESGMASGVALGAHDANFTYVASQVGCNTTNTTTDDAVFACMQSAPASSIIQVYNKYNATLHGGIALAFSPTVDNVTVFANYTERQQRGLFARLPSIISQVHDEGSSLLAYTPQGPPGGQAAIDARTKSWATCPDAHGALARKNWGLPVWRVHYFGTWPNLNPFDWLGAYHSSDLPMVFGTSDLRGADTPEEKATSRYYQDAWAAFARDPVHGLTAYGWPTYDPEGQTLIKLGNGSVSAVFAKGDTFDAGC